MSAGNRIRGERAQPTTPDRVRGGRRRSCSSRTPHRDPPAVATLGRLYDDVVYLSVGKSIADGHGYRSAQLVGTPVHVEVSAAAPGDLRRSAGWRSARSMPSRRMALWLNIVVTAASAGALWWLARRELAVSPVVRGAVRHRADRSPTATMFYFSGATSEPWMLLGWATSLVLVRRLTRLAAAGRTGDRNVASRWGSRSRRPRSRGRRDRRSPRRFGGAGGEHESAGALDDRRGGRDRDATRRLGRLARRHDGARPTVRRCRIRAATSRGFRWAASAEFARFAVAMTRDERAALLVERGRRARRLDVVEDARCSPAAIVGRRAGWRRAARAAVSRAWRRASSPR